MTSSNYVNFKFSIVVLTTVLSIVYLLKAYHYPLLLKYCIANLDFAYIVRLIALFYALPVNMVSGVVFQYQLEFDQLSSGKKMCFDMMNELAKLLLTISNLIDAYNYFYS